MRIAVYAICKNESQFVDRWMDSMSEADQVVVLDTGSTDDTVERLKKRGAQVTVELISPWRFDVARNRSMELVPEDGVIFPTTTVTFYEGESVFNVLQREMRKAGIHMEFEDTPMYNSAYIEGINNLYEFDCGELSGWMYKVNGWFPNYGCSRYQLKEGDVIEWVYTCDLGVDVGGFYSTGE